MNYTAQQDYIRTKVRNALDESGCSYICLCVSNGTVMDLSEVDNDLHLLVFQALLANKLVSIE